MDEVIQTAVAGVGLRRLGTPVRFAHVDARRPLSSGLARGEFDALRRAVADLFAGDRGRRPKTAPLRFPVWRDAVPFLSIPKAAAWLAAADRAARMDRRVRQVTLSLGETRRRVAGRTTTGSHYGDGRDGVTFVVQVTAASGSQVQTGTEVAAASGGWGNLPGFDPGRLAATAARRAVRKLEAPAVRAGEMPVVIAAEAGGTLIHEAVGHSLEADAIGDGSSPYFAGKIGQRVAGDKVSVWDDPTRPGQRGSFVFDDEGVPAEPTVLIENGILRNYLCDRRSADRVGRSSNGHGRRESFAHVPVPRMSNTFIAPGPDDPVRIRRELRRGLFVTRLGGGQVDTATGDFVFEVEEGFWVENGRVRHPVRGANLLGNGPQVLNSIDRVGTDLGWSVGTCGKEGQHVPVSDGLPTLRIPKVVVGGSSAR